MRFEAINDPLPSVLAIRYLDTVLSTGGDRDHFLVLWVVKHAQRLVKIDHQYYIRQIKK